MSVICRLCNECVIGRSYPILNALPGITCVRWRKPRYKPKAKSKEFIVRKPTPINEEESAELKMRFAHYNTLTRGIRRSIDELLFEENKTMKDVKKQKTATAFEMEYERMVEVNKEWNEKIKTISLSASRSFKTKLRKTMRNKTWEARQTLEAEENEQELERIRKMKAKRADILKKEAVERLKYDAVQAGSFVTPDNFEQKFAEALKKKPTDFEFAVDIDGKVIKDAKDDGPVIVDEFKFVRTKTVEDDVDTKS